MTACSTIAMAWAQPTMASPINLWVGPEQVPCFQAADGNCLLVRQVPQSHYSLWPHAIAGFTYAAGYHYQLQVRPPDAETTAWTLVELIEQSLAPGPLEAYLWQLHRYYTSAGEVVKVLPSTTLTLEFALPNQMRGTTGCNDIQGNYQRQSQRLTLTVDSSTLFYCPEPGYMAQEVAYLNALTRTVHFQVENRELQLLDASHTPLLTFHAQVASGPALAYRLWELRGLVDHQGNWVPPLRQSRVTLIFDNQGGAIGFAGCNPFMATYERQASQLHIQSPMLGRRYCPQPEGIMTQETLFLEWLEVTASFEVRGNQLDLKTDQGKRVASFRQIVPMEEETTGNLSGSVAENSNGL
ncbi:META domain-containing protein [Halomicronema hongdechloris]|nr:META domain-containing protein [Halomicronema hongdechloris]